MLPRVLQENLNYLTLKAAYLLMEHGNLMQTLAERLNMHKSHSNAC